MADLRDLSRQLRERRQGPRASLPRTCDPDPFQPRPTPTPRLEHDPDLLAQVASIQGIHPRLHAELEQLDPAQLRAVLSRDPTALVQAHVGSGKTTVLVMKVLTLHLVDGLPLDRIAVLTFTNRAAGEVRDRLDAFAHEGTSSPACWLVGTFHSVARRLLTRSLPLERISYRDDFGVLDEHERDELRHQLIRENRLDIRRRSRLTRRLEAFRQTGFDSDGEPPQDDLAQLASLEAQEKVRRGLMDFDDLIEHATTLLRLAPLEPHPLWIVVDEFQDTDPEELAFLDALAAPSSAFFAVGDPNQVIYTWRGSRPDLFETFRASRDCTLYSLPINYRSTRSILEAARTFLEIEENELVGVRGEGARLRIVRHHSPYIEAQYLTQRLDHLHTSGIPWNEMAVLYRIRRQAHPFREAFTRAGIPFQEAVRRSLRDLPVLDWLHRLLRAALTPTDLESFRHALTHPRYGRLSRNVWHASSWKSWQSRHDTTDVSSALEFLSHRLGESRDDRDTLEACRRLAAFPQWLSTSANPTTLADDLLAHLEVERCLHPTAPTFDKDLDLVRRFLDDLLIVFGTESIPSPSDLRTGLAEVVLGGHQLLEEELDPHADSVRLLTLHASKGLEFSHVFLSGANEGLLPLTGPWRGPENDAEERRLFFVALTRARNALEISYHTEPEFRSALPNPSPYLDLVPAALVERMDTPETAPSLQPKEESSSGWQVGASIHHPRYGKGTLEQISGGQLLCHFSGHGSKSFAEAFAPIVPSSDIPPDHRRGVNAP